MPKAKQDLTLNSLVETIEATESTLRKMRLPKSLGLSNLFFEPIQLFTLNSKISSLQSQVD